MTDTCRHPSTWINVQRVELPDGSRRLRETCVDCGALLADKPVPKVEPAT